MLVFLGGFVLMLERASLQVLGNASFFAGIVTVMLPPMFAPQVFLLAAATLVVGQCIGWAWGCAAMVASLRARDQVLLLSQVQRAQAGIAGATNPDVEYRREIFEGAFLSWRSTLVHGFFFAVGLFALGLIRAKMPKLMILSIFGTIVLDIMCSYGPLFPVQQYTLATTFLIPTACYLAIALAGTILIFPQTLNYSWTTDLVDKFLSPVLQRSHLHSRLLHEQPPSFDPAAGDAPSPWSPFTSVVLSTQEAMSSALEGLLGGIGMLELEVSFGRLGAKDLKSLADSLRELHVRGVGLAVLFTTVQSGYEHGSDTPTRKAKSPRGGGADERPFTETARMQRVRERLGGAERQNKHDLGSLLPVFASASHDLREASDGALVAAMDWLTAQNDSRWRYVSRGKAQEADRFADLQAQVERLEREIDLYRSERRKAVLEPFADFFDPHTGHLRPFAERGPDKLFAPGSLFTILAASDNLTQYSTAVLSFSSHLSALAERRRTNHLWLPSGLRRVGNLVKGRHGESGPTALGDGEDPDSVPDVGDESDEEEDHPVLQKKEQKRKKNKDDKPKTRFEEVMEKNFDAEARPPKNALQRGTRRLDRFFRWWASPDAIFALKYVVGSICIWLFQVFPSTAYLSYSQKVLWTLITFQTFLAPNAGDQILSTLQRCAGTVVGLVYGMLIWYIGAGRGDGTRPGIGAALFVLMIPWFAVRLYAPPSSAMFGIMAAVTSVLIVGYSWQDTHLPALGNPGVGYSVAWRRALLVLIGAGIAAVFLLIPPQSSRRLVRRTHATCVHELGRLYTAIVSEWLSEEGYDESASVDRERDGSKEGADLRERDEPFSAATRQVGRAKMLALRVKLNSSRIAIEQAAFEPSLRGDWPKDNYTRLLTLQLALLQALAQLAQALIRLDHTWRERLVHETAFLNQPLLATRTDTPSLRPQISLALREGAPLPEATPGPLLDRLLQHDRRLRLFSEGGMPSSSRAPAHDPAHDDDDDDDDVNHADEAHGASVEGARVGSFALTLSVLRDERFAAYAAALQALAGILRDCDALEREVKRLVGETRFPGYAALRARERVEGV
ncbi:uncharacterized protein RHOBADRAFT_31005 [Rhodotorula graminis WP1]|uniref:ER transporter 6TM N-terminal domain-containing protein n=1 Tax=Rhodotorula graminis (strain WP1) TaxID=578459 RepID=A0A0P9GVX2_RHOGW|nr:uncharacterized protein RHOBADRAFT_31005 [Rhodotorula graminis WP1]KPV71578.1 hypothetical protein RHOBADRAFT_31005 [Rhodotorula graminis WP1]